MKRGLYRTEAVVLNSFDYGESDRILVFFTLDFGKVKGIAKGARRSRKRFVGNLDPGCRITLIFFLSEKSDLVRVEDAALIEGPSGLGADIERLSQAYYLLELTSEMTREGQTIPAAYHLLTAFLRMLPLARDPGPLLRFFEVKLLSLAGLLPHLDDCVVCRGPVTGPPGAAGRPLYFSSELGGVVCAGCGRGNAAGFFRISPATAGLLSMAARLEPGKLARLKADASFAAEGERLMDDFIRRHVGKELKTKVFLNKLKSAFKISTGKSLTEER